MSDNWPSPCVLCGYNGPGFYQPEKHPCMEWETERDALLGEIDRLNRVVDAVKRDLDEALGARVELDPGEELAPLPHIWTQEWCDGTKPCALSDSGKEPHGHWRTKRSLQMHAVMHSVAERQRESCELYLRNKAEEIMADEGERELAISLHRAADRVEDTPLVTHSNFPFRKGDDSEDEVEP